MLCNMEWQATNWEDAASTGSFSTQAQGAPVVAKDLLFCLGDERYDLMSASVDLGLEFTPKTALEAANARSGYKCTRMLPTITCKFYYNETLFNALVGDSTTEPVTQDINLQCGVTAGSAWAFRMRDGDPRDVKHTATDGIETIDVTFRATRSVWPNFQIAIF